MGSNAKIDSKIPVQESQLSTVKKTVLWKIKKVSEIKNLNAWSAIYCRLEIGDATWKITLFSDGKFLYARPILLHPSNQMFVYRLKTSVVNNNDIVVYTPGLANQSAVTSGANTPEPFKWEIMKLGDTAMDLFGNYVFDDTLKILIEMVLYEDRAE